jgi:outer membrane protein assembly factor BamB
MHTSGPRQHYFAPAWLCGVFVLIWIGSTDLTAATTQFLHELRSDDAAAGDEFGRSVAVDGRIGIIGAPLRDEAAVDSGAAYLFDVLTGQQLLKLVPDDGQEMDGFGMSVSIQGNRAVVGAMYDDDHGKSAGAAYVFDTSTGQQLYKLMASDAAPGDEFGVSVDIDDGVILVGAHMNGPGAAYLFNAQTGIELGVLQADDAAPNDLFGVAVALDGGKALVGARYDDDAAIASGSAYIFQVNTRQQLHKLTPHDGDRGDRFGMHLDIGGNRAVVGSRYDDDAIKSSGSAYIYDVDTGQELLKLVAADATPSDEFGSAIAVSGNYVVVGAVDDDHNGWYAGSAYLFDMNTGDQLFKFNAADTRPFDRLGMSVAANDEFILLGSSMLNYPGVPHLASGKVDVHALPEPSALAMTLSGLLLAAGGFCRR